VSIQVGLEEIVLVMGPNGAGKSTLIKGVTGELPALSGKITLDGLDVTAMGEEDRVAHGVGYVPQLKDVFPPLSVQENIEMGGYAFKGADLREREEEVYSLFPQLAGSRRRAASTLSGGERKMLGIARALMARPRLLILDEPTANLAPLIAEKVLQSIVTGAAGSGRAVLLIEQRVSLGLEVASWGYILTDGQLKMEGSAEELRAIPDLGKLFLGRGTVESSVSGTH
jgi:branched-chain amino acid transport system ATP-binding protein